MKHEAQDVEPNLYKNRLWIINRINRAIIQRVSSALWMVACAPA
jgi:hypothetical protein